MTKKLQFLLVSLLLTAGFFGELQLPARYLFFFVLLWGGVAYLVSFLVLRYDLVEVELVTLLTLPTLFTVAVGGVFAFFPSFSATFRLLIMALFSLGFYLILLAENVFNVGRERSIPLLKAAGTVSFLLTLLTAFLLFTVLFKAALPVACQWLLLFFLAFLLGFQSLWTIVLGTKLDARLFLGSCLFALAVLELAVATSFWPLESFFRALVLSTGFYVFLGIAFHYYKKTLKGKIFLEYAAVALLVALVLFLL